MATKTNLPQTGITPAYVRVQTAAQYVGVSKSLLDKLRTTGGGPRFSLLGSAVVYSLADLEAWVASRSVASTSEGGSLPSISTDARSRQIVTTPPATRRGRPRKAVVSTLTQVGG